LLKKHGKEFSIPDGFVWGAEVPSTSSFMLAGTRIFGVDCAVADDLTEQRSKDGAKSGLLWT
jgi:hypothetical protein